MNYLTSHSNFISRFFNDPTDLLYKDFFNNENFVTFFEKPKLDYPLDIIEYPKTLEFNIAAIGIDKKDIDIEVKDGNILSISYNKEPVVSGTSAYLYKGITNKSFKFAFKIHSKFDLSKLEASLDKGLLKISIPIIPEKTPKKFEIS